MNDVQKVILDIYKEVAKVCEQLSVRYFAIGGTAIGAARHKGFIPWDDDLDLALPIEDYELFLSQAQELLPDYLEIRTYYSITHNQNVFAKVVDARTTNIEPNEAGYPDAYKGIYVDIMPMSGIPAGIRKPLFIGKVALFGAIAYGLPWRFHDRKTFKHRALWLATRPLKPFLSITSVLQSWEKALINEPFNEASFTGCTWWPKVYGLVFPSEWFASCTMMQFEDTQIRMPVGYHEYLTQQFGNYMELPPADNRISHQGFIDLAHSYKDYEKGARQIPIGYFATKN